MVRQKFSELSEKNKRLVMLIELMLFAILIMVLYLTRLAYNAGNVEHYADPSDKPVVRADNGILSFNTVSVEVPKKGARYAIGYDQASDDEDYPSVPSMASACYSDDKGGTTYEILLYRNLVIPKATDHETYTMDDWFNEWKPETDKYEEPESYKTAHTAGFLIKNKSKENCSYTYFFAVETESDIEQYVLELDYYDIPNADKAADIFKTVSESLSVRKKAV